MAEGTRADAIPSSDASPATPAATYTKKLPWSVASRTVTERGVESGQEWERPRRVSRQVQFLSELGGYAERKRRRDPKVAANPGSLLSTGPMELHRKCTSLDGGKTDRTKEEYETRLARFEDFVIFALPDDCGEHKRLRAFEAAVDAGDDAHEPDGPTYKDAVETFIHIMMAPKDKVFVAESTAFKGTAFTGRGCGFPTPRGLLSALRWVDLHIMNETRLLDAEIVGIARTLAKVHVASSAFPFDIEEVLPRFREAIFANEFEERKNPFNTAIQREQVWTMFMVSLAVCARCSLLTTFCPMLDQLELGPVDEDGVPKFIKIELREWKGNANGAKQQRLLLRRNLVNVDFCPVIAIITWIKTLVAQGIKNGPLFPALDNNHNSFIVEKDTGRLQRMEPGRWKEWFRRSTRYVGGAFANCSTHSIRRSVVKWAARCGAQTHAIMEAGRWANYSCNFMTYWRDGQARSSELQAVGTSEDPIWKIWAWQPPCLELSGAGGGGGGGGGREG